MTNLQMHINAIRAEFLKLKREKITLLTAVAFGIAPVMGAVFIVILGNADLADQAGMLSSKALALNFQPDWTGYFLILTQAVGVGGIMVFGFIASWIFGREYAQGTYVNLLALPASRTAIVNAKFLVYICWCFAVSVSNLILSLLLVIILQANTGENPDLSSLLIRYFTTVALTVFPGFVIAFFAIYGRGYLAPLAFVALILVFAQIIAAAGIGHYFPWSVPGLYSGISPEHFNALNWASYLSVIATGIVGYLLTVFYWKYADQ